MTRPRRERPLISSCDRVEKRQLSCRTPNASTVGCVRVGGLGRFVAVVVTNPGHAVREGSFVAAFGSHVQEVVGAEKNVRAAGVGGVGVEAFAGGVFVKDT